MNLCLLCDSLPPLRSSASSMAPCLLRRPLSLLRPSVSSTTLTPLYETCFFSSFREIMLFCCFAEHLSLKRAISRNSETTPFVL
jgi:hypothetical protein